MKILMEVFVKILVEVPLKILVEIPVEVLLEILMEIPVNVPVELLFVTEHMCFFSLSITAFRSETFGGYLEPPACGSSP